MIDDLDRLRLNEIRDVVSLVRLNADLPNVVFVLAYDRRRVEEALEGIEGDGRAYLEKIVQVVYDLPEVREADLSRVLVDAINGVLGRTTITGPFDQDRLHGVLALVIRPLFKTVRDVRRYTNSLFPTLEVVGDEVALDDVLAIEAVRVLLPDVYAEIVSSVEALTTPAGLAGSFSRSSDRDQEARLQVHRVIDAGEEHSETVRELIGRIFPAGVRHLENKHYGHDWVKTWSKDRRLAHQRVLRFYLEKRLPEGRRGFLAPMAEDRLHAVVRRLLEKVEDGEARQRVVRLAEPMIRSPRPRLSALTTSWLGSNLGYLGSCWRRLSARTASSVALGSSVVVIIDKIWMRGQWARSRRRSGTWADNVLTSKC